MRELSYLVVAMVGIAGFWLGFGTKTPPSPAVIGRGLGGPELEALEARVSREPRDSSALYDLAETYLAHDAPGLAQAALERAPQKLRETPRIADVRARALWGLGSAELALKVQRSMLDACERQHCSPALLARAQRREWLFAEMVRVGIDDPKEDPNRVLLAYRRSTREVTLDVE